MQVICEHEVKNIPYGKISQPQHYWRLVWINLYYVCVGGGGSGKGAVVATVECLAASLNSPYWVLVALPAVII